MEVSNHNNGKDATFGAIKTLDVFSKKKKLCEGNNAS